MKKSKILIPALALLCVSTAAAVTGTVAWFSTNGKVTAKEMHVKARTAQNLLIKNSSSSAEYAEEADAATTSAYTLTPVSTADASSFFKVKYESENKVDYNSGMLKKGSIIVACTDGAVESDPVSDADDKVIIYDYIKYVFTLKADMPEEEGNQFDHIYLNDLTIKNTASTPADPAENISKALRVAVVSADETFIFAPCGGDTEYEALNAITDDSGVYADVTNNTTPVKKDASTEISESITVLSGVTEDTHDFGELEAQEELEISVYVWYEGQDSECKSVNALVQEELNLSISFEGKND